LRGALYAAQRPLPPPYGTAMSTGAAGTAAGTDAMTAPAPCATHTQACIKDSDAKAQGSTQGTIKEPVGFWMHASSLQLTQPFALGVEL